MKRTCTMILLLDCACSCLNAATTTTAAPTLVPESYRGWVNLAENDDPAELPRDNYSTSNFSQASIDGSDTIWFCDKTTGRAIRYRREVNTIYIGRAHPVDMLRTFEGTAREMGLAVSLDPLQSEWKSAGLAVKQSTDGSLERYVVSFSPNAKTFWFDPATKRVVKTQGQTAGKVWTQFYRYNAPAVREIYDMGAPKNAKILDNRPTGELKEILDRIDARLDAGLGGCVGVVTTTPLDSAGNPEPNTGLLTIFAQDGKKWMTHSFPVGERRVPVYLGAEEIAPALPLPTDWPTPQVAPLVEPLAKAIPNYTYVSDGLRGWRVEFKPVDDWVASLTDVGTDYGAGVHAKTWFFVWGDIWVGSERLFCFNPETVLTLKRDATKRPGLIGILATDSRGSHEAWIDPSRDDLPVEYIHMRNDSPQSTMTEHWQFEGFTQLAGGQWYPKQWTRAISYQRPLPLPTQATVMHLQIDPQLRLGQAWFGNPIARVGSKPIAYSRP